MHVNRFYCHIPFRFIFHHFLYLYNFLNFEKGRNPISLTLFVYIKYTLESASRPKKIRLYKLLPLFILANYFYLSLKNRLILRSFSKEGNL